MLHITLPGQPTQAVGILPEGLVWEGQNLPVAYEAVSAHTYHAVLNNRSYEISLLKFDAEKGQVQLRINGKKVVASVQTLEDRMLETIGLDRAALLKVADLKAPMPGLVRKVFVQPGSTLQAGDPVLVLEAMKMENVLKSPTAGTVAEVLVQENAAVEKNAVLVKFA
jgi:biotin carboxyl carrier protein